MKMTLMFLLLPAFLGVVIAQPAKTQPDYGVAGPWRFRVLEFETAVSREVSIGGQKHKLEAKGGGVIALVKVRLQSTRKLTSEEQKAMRQVQLEGDPKNTPHEIGVRLFGMAPDDPFLFSTGFTIAFAEGEGEKKKLVLSQCRAMSGDESVRHLTSQHSELVVGFPSKPEFDVTLAFACAAKASSPLLLVQPVPGGKIEDIARITSRDPLKVEYGTAEAMKKYLPPELRAN